MGETFMLRAPKPGAQADDAPAWNNANTLLGLNPQPCGEGSEVLAGTPLGVCNSLHSLADHRVNAHELRSNPPPCPQLSQRTTPVAVIEPPARQFDPVPARALRWQRPQMPRALDL